MVVSSLPPPDPAARMRKIRARVHEASLNSPRQHTLSQALQKRFTRTVPHNKWELLRFDLRHEQVRSQSAAPGNCGMVVDFVPYASTSLETYWSKVENGFHAGFAALDDGTLFSNPAMISVMRDIVALHYVRSPRMKDVHDATFHAGQEQKRTELRRRPWNVRQDYWKKTGIHTIGDQAVEYIIGQRLQEPADLAASGALLRERLPDMYEKVRARLDDFSVEILMPESAEFLISDSPVVNPNELTGRAVDEARLDDDDFYLPVGRSHVVRLHYGPQYGYRSIPGDQVEKLNIRQVEAARKYVFAHPDSGLDAFIEQARRNRIRSSPV